MSPKMTKHRKRIPEEEDEAENGRASSKIHNGETKSERKLESGSEPEPEPEFESKHGKSRKKRSRSRSRSTSKRRSRRKYSDSDESDSSSSSSDDEDSDSSGESESDSDSSESSSETEEERRRRKRKERKRREEREKERRRRRRREKEKKRRKKDGDEGKKTKSKKHKKDKDKGKKGAVTNSWGKYGIIRETDMWNKRPEFSAWLAEVKKVNLESLPNWEEKQMFKQFMEDHNTATFPSKKYYDLNADFKRQLEKEIKRGSKKALDPERTIFNDEEQRRQELMREREKQKEEQVEALKSSMQSGMAQAMKEQARLREEMAYQYKLGNFEAAAAIQRRLDPDVAM